jgi:hypothetical protein
MKVPPPRNRNLHRESCGRPSASTRNGDAQLQQSALDFLKGCVAAAIPRNDPIARPAGDWLDRRFRPVAERQPVVQWTCQWFMAQLILDRTTADLVITATTDGDANPCQEFS